MVPNMFKEAGMTKKATNHSLRVTGTTEMYHCGVPKNVIKERTGHKSLDGLRAYERTTIEQQRAVLRILTDPNRPVPGSFNLVLEKEEQSKTVHVGQSQNAPESPKWMKGCATPRNLFNLQGCKVTIVQASLSHDDLNDFDLSISKHPDNFPYWKTTKLETSCVLLTEAAVLLYYSLHSSFDTTVCKVTGVLLHHSIVVLLLTQRN